MTLLKINCSDLIIKTISFSGKLPNPRIVEHPQDSYVAKMTPAKLNCRAEGDPKPVITWYRDGIKVITTDKDPESNKMLVDGGALFFLQIIHNKNNKPDVGVYYCNATNIYGSAISRNATLKLAGKFLTIMIFLSQSF